MSVTTLKRIALVAMILNYIGAFIPGTPIWLQWLGCLAAPVFFYCVAWGVDKTHNKRFYFQRLYLCSILMSLVNLILSIVVQKTSLATTVTSNIFSTLFACIFFIQIVEYGRKHPRKRNRLWLTYAFWQFTFAILWALLYEVVGVPYAFLKLASAVSGSVLTCEGGLLYVLMGAIFYYTKEDKRTLAISYFILCLVFFLNSAFGLWGRLFMLLGGDLLVAFMEIITGLVLWGASFRPLFDITHMLNNDFQWMILAALPLILCCNGERGRGKKYFYYVFYPAHIYVLWFLGSVILR